MSNLINVIPGIDPSGFEDIFVNSGLDDEYVFSRLKELKNIDIKRSPTAMTQVSSPEHRREEDSTPR